MSSLGRMIDSAVHCIQCGKPGVGTCDCWEHCSCGWWADKGKPCRNPNTTRCSTKMKYGPKPQRKKASRGA